MAGKTDSPRNPRPTERVMVFIDGSNLYHVLTQTCGRHDLRFGKFIEKLSSGRDLVRAYYYNVRQDRAHNPAAAQEQDRFLASLDEVPYLETRLGVYKQRGPEMVEKGVDVMIATDLVSGAFKNLYDTAILVSGDGDFFPAIEAVKDLGKHVEVAAFENNLSPEAERAADVTTMLRPSYFTALWTSRSRPSSDGVGSRQRGGRGDRGAGERGTGDRSRTGERGIGERGTDERESPERESGERVAGEAVAMPPIAPAEEDEVVGRVERPEIEAAPERPEPAAEKPAQRGERRRFGRRRRGGGSGGAGGGASGGAGGGAGRGQSGPSDRQDRQQDTAPQVSPAPESQPQAPQPPPHQRQPLRPPRLRNVPRGGAEPAAQPGGGESSGSGPDRASDVSQSEGGNGEARIENQPTQPRRRLAWFRRRLTTNLSDSGPGNASPAPAG